MGLKFSVSYGARQGQEQISTVQREAEHIGVCRDPLHTVEVLETQFPRRCPPRQWKLSMNYLKVWTVGEQNMQSC